MKFARFRSSHDAFPKAILHLLLDYRDFSLIRSRRVPEDIPRCIRRPIYQRGHFSERIVRIRHKPTVMGTGEWNLRDSRRETSEVSGLWDQGFLFQSVQGRPDYSSRLLGRWRFDRILRWMCYSGWVGKKIIKILSSLSPVCNKYCRMEVLSRIDFKCLTFKVLSLSQMVQ